MTDTRICLLGAMQIERDGRSLSGIRSQKALALLGYLVVEERPVARTTLAALFWGNEPTTKARRELRRVIHNLTSLVPGCLEADRHTVRFNAALGSASLWVDVGEFAEFARADDMDCKKQAADLYRGELMEGLYLDACPQFETWLLGERELLRQQAFQVFQQLMAFHTKEADFETAVTLTQRCLAIDPWREETHRQLMLLQARNGQISAALKQFEKCHTLLTAELGVEPSLETVSLYERIKAAANVKAHNLLPDVTPFVGRTLEISKLQRFLADPTCRLITIVGLGGMGKSRLATAVTRQIANDKKRMFLHGAFFVPLAEVETAVDLSIAIATTLGLTLRDSRNPEAQLVAYLKEREILLLLDNYEQLLPHTSLVSNLLQQVPRLKLLVTSRERLNLRSETLFELDGLAYPQVDTAKIDGSTAREYGAIALFEISAMRVQAQFKLEQTVAPVIKLCQMVNGMPLALELAAGWLHTQTLPAMLEDLQRDLDILVTTQADMPLRHRSWRIVFQSSWQRLSLIEQQVMDQLSVFRGGFTAEAATAVTQVTRAILAQLVSKSLLRMDGNGRYYIHELLRQYARQQLENDPAKFTTAIDAHAQHFCNYLAAHENNLTGNQQAVGLQAIEIELDNCRTAWQATLNQQQENMLAVTIWPLALFFLIRGDFRAGLQWFAKTAQAQPLTEIIYSRCLLWQSTFLLHIGLYSEAKRLFDQVEEQITNSFDERDSAWTNYISAKIMIAAADEPNAYATAKTLMQGVLEQVGEFKRPFLFAFFLTQLAEMLRAAEQDEQQAEKYLQTAKQIFQASGNPWGLLNVNVLLGDLARQQNKTNMARLAYEASLASAKRIESSWGQGMALKKSGILAEQNNDPATAMQLYDQSLQHVWKSADLNQITYLLQDIVRTALKAGEVNRALYLAERNLQLAAEIGDPTFVAHQTHFMGHIYKAAGDLKAARQQYAAALLVLLETDPNQAAWSILGIGQVDLFEGDEDAALERFERSLVLFEQVGSLNGTAVARANLAATYRRMGNDNQAMQLYTENLPVWLALNDDVGVGVYLANVARINVDERPLTWVVQLLIAALTLIKTGQGEPMAPQGIQEIEQLLSACQTQLDTEIFEQAQQSGQTLSLDTAVALAQSSV